MGASSTVSLQDVMDYVRTQGSVSPVVLAGGFTNLQAITTATDVMKDLLAQRFNHKFNSFMPPAFYTNSWQQDYPQVNITTMAWLESCESIDINNTALPKPLNWPEAVRDLQRTNWAASPVQQIAWEYNSLLYKGTWPGAGVTYTQPLGAPQIPTNPHTAILDANNNILLVTTYGTTGDTPPLAVVNAWTPNSTTTVNDGSVVWTVCNPEGQGFRIFPLPPQAGVVYKVMPRAQARPPIFTTVQQLLNPLPDDFAGWFRDLFDVYSYRMSPDPTARLKFPEKRAQMLDALANSTKVGDRERDAARFVPVSGIMGGSENVDPGPANPYNWAGYTWRG